ncbi:diguanylate cyclase [Oscillibacter sp. 1-3]|uniref:diguanylate cyclase n=1 Tax=Oscillibacter sp. 1-3 TaxID=1235797 RepID=UPI000337A065|nr:diguanylate cyclase [Oscillibacter sp. 1-3]EOS65127.1 diguanylate cyclase (GGDEF) domain-containing protein [Oscillibacter sp. 1-3]MCI9511622.1 diguanylate cyclase [Oscillibacter sp.]
MKKTRKEKILIVDDSELNRAILADMLGEEYDIVEAENGLEGVGILQKMGTELSLVLLDIVMPEMDGFGVLDTMHQNHWIDDIPVIMISAESGSSHIERAYELGVTDFIARPFDALIVHRRVVNTLLLYAKQKKLVGMVADQIYEKERQGNLMIDILSHIVEFRNGESGLHVLHVRTLTELLLHRLSQKTDRYRLTPGDISIITTASSLHDIGKIAIDENILNKPGKLTEEEFTVMKTHTTVGADMLENLPIHQHDPLVKVAYQICRWHHERYDGRGYPDGLQGDDIPISAQVVALADVYDALTSVRVYKPPFPHDEAVQMILDGKCGTFNPLLLECLQENSEIIRSGLTGDTQAQRDQREMRNISQEMHRYEELTASERTLQLLEHERMKYSFFAAMTQEIQFEYTASPAMVTISAWGAEKLGLGETVMDPLHNEGVLALMDPEWVQGLSNALHSTCPDQPVVSYDCQLNLNGETRWYRIVARAIWSADEPARYTGAIGKAIDIHDSRMKLHALEQMASHDTLTGLLNHAYAKKRILERIEGRPTASFALAIFDLDHFKSANDTYGHSFGDHVLTYVAEKLRQSIRGGDIAARVGGDEFLIFLEHKGDVEPVVSRIFESLCGTYEDFTISVSMGIAPTALVGCDYDTLFHAADQALYTVKRGGRGRYRFYDETMKQMLSVISPIDDGGGDAETASADQKGDGQI